jgi:hypothetical protein
MNRYQGVCGCSSAGTTTPDQWSEEVWAEDFALMRAASVNLATVAVLKERQSTHAER